MPAPLRDVPQEGIELIKSFEGIPDGDPSTVNIDAYLDPVGIWTIGWGHAISVGGQFLRGAANKPQARAMFPGGITRAQAEALLRGDLIDTAAGVANAVKKPLNDNQFGALVSFAFNAGLGNLRQSTLLRKLNAGDMAGAADQFLVWNKARDGHGVLQELAGLTRRRRAERALFLGQDWRAASGPVTRGRVEMPMGSGKPEAPAGEGAAPRKAAAKKAAAKKTVAKKTAAKKAVAKKAPAKRSAKA